MVDVDDLDVYRGRAGVVAGAGFKCAVAVCDKHADLVAGRVGGNKVKLGVAVKVGEGYAFRG